MTLCFSFHSFYTFTQFPQGQRAKLSLFVFSLRMSLSSRLVIFITSIQKKVPPQKRYMSNLILDLNPRKTQEQFIFKITFNKNQIEKKQLLNIQSREKAKKQTLKCHTCFPLLSLLVIFCKCGHPSPSPPKKTKKNNQ